MSPCQGFSKWRPDKMLSSRNDKEPGSSEEGRDKGRSYPASSVALQLIAGRVIHQSWLHKPSFRPMTIKYRSEFTVYRLIAEQMENVDFLSRPRSSTRGMHRFDFNWRAMTPMLWEGTAFSTCHSTEKQRILIAQYRNRVRVSAFGVGQVALSFQYVASLLYFEIEEYKWSPYNWRKLGQANWRSSCFCR